MITADNVSKILPIATGELTILNHVSLSVNDGDSLAIIGPSGAGKSTLLGLLAGLDTPSTGSITLSDYCITNMNEEQRAEIRAKFVGFVFQTFQLLPGLSAIENVSLPLELTGRKRASEMAKEYLSKVGLAERLSHYPKQMSGGEQQRVAIARAFACEPKVLFADEPTGNLDSKTGGEISDLLFEMNKEQQTTLVLVTHEHRLADRCDSRLMIDSGEVTENS
ncbi:MAG: ABC transporter ATP-binding protein [Arenicellaceae bacterium]|nr:ABC transporter ATP-binding protein [Arenicellaceae bacterium]